MTPKVLIILGSARQSRQGETVARFPAEGKEEGGRFVHSPGAMPAS